MNSTEKLISLAVDSPSPEEKKKALQRLAGRLRQQLQEAVWYTESMTDFLESQIEPALTQVIARLIPIGEYNPTALQRNIELLSHDLPSVLFFTPRVIRLLYSPHASIPAGFINEGIDRHCKIIRTTCRNVVRKHVGGLSSLSIDLQDLEEELWGCVMEELVRTMTDMSARLWHREIPEPALYPPLESRGRRKGFMQCVAITEDAKTIAAARSDQTLLVWDAESREMLHQWDYALSMEEEGELTPHRVFFSRKGKKLALEFKEKIIYIFQLGGGSLPIKRYDEEEKEHFLRDFGIPYIPKETVLEKQPSPFPVPAHWTGTWNEYRENVLDAAWDKKADWLVTGSEKERDVPAWMADAGFERAVNHIAKMRLIDMIRKHTHTDYACWRCGSTRANRAETQCPECGADFTRCPIGCDTELPGLLGPENDWKCSRCGLATRITHTQQEVDGSQLQIATAPEQHDWASQHDLERILHALRHITITYRGRQISCPQMVLLKTQGKTNEEIGQELGIPRGSVDYIWNQCRREVLELMSHA
ncbi:MAG: hypothetical protein RBU29_06040 [bacterium]|jgi:hypothetical protein|nr:hypothetical protein [bacterium]